ncbi:MAG: IS3 family transposase [Bdellovibrionaceae bacterium]|nr:IS3 family transposase [Pseudobdellovibrionaceae bacterium]
MNTVNGVAVNLSCETLEVSRSGYYAWLSREPSMREIYNAELLPWIEAIHAKSKETYGSPRVTAELRAEGECVNEKRIARLMRENEITSDAVKKFKVQTTDSNHDLPIADRIFETEHASSVMAPDQVYVGDITYVQTEEEFLFLAIFMDIFTRKIVGHKADDNMRSDLVLEALLMALSRQDVERDQLIAHSDRGSENVRTKMNLCKIIASMSRKGNGWDNAHCESFFHSMKTELVYRTKFKPRATALSFRIPGPVRKTS